LTVDMIKSNLTRTGGIPEGQRSEHERLRCDMVVFTFPSSPNDIASSTL
jgi:hypothetical protein